MHVAYKVLYRLSIGPPTKHTVAVVCVRDCNVLATVTDTRAVLSQGEPRDAAINFDMYRILQRHRALSVPQHGFLVGLCMQTAGSELSVKK